MGGGEGGEGGGGGGGRQLQESKGEFGGKGYITDMWSKLHRIVQKKFFVLLTVRLEMGEL